MYKCFFVDVKSVPVMTSLQTSKATRDHLENLYAETKTLNLHKFHPFTAAGLEEDEFKEMLESMQNMMSCYDTMQMAIV